MKSVNITMQCSSATNTLAIFSADGEGRGGMEGGGGDKS
jgi:hypothetical protein